MKHGQLNPKPLSQETGWKFFEQISAHARGGVVEKIAGRLVVSRLFYNPNWMREPSLTILLYREGKPVDLKANFAPADTMVKLARVESLEDPDDEVRTLHIYQSGDRIEFNRQFGGFALHKFDDDKEMDEHMIWTPPYEADIQELSRSFDWLKPSTIRS